jgi:hypothetical protein
MTQLRTRISITFMRDVAEYAFRHLRYVADQPQWEIHQRFVDREMDPGERLIGNCKTYALNCALQLHGISAKAWGKPDHVADEHIRHAIRIGYFDTDESDALAEDHVACMAWDGDAWRLIADTMQARPLDIPALNEVTDRRLKAWSDLTDLTISTPVDPA